ncbi:MAG: hypothetical protein Q8R06_13670 [Polaromonas sp.]|uniref:hypothetical protein n=1 Tax=Polaromonas sp. TaxID=1869339 RepID=UPI002736F8F7|nr:hypothetical protein [Polaromonas sp.]MDP3798174.1 hypothetical protein [Polaromonas sp.]
MNSRHVHQFMRERFPAFDSAAMTWTNVADVDSPRVGEIEALLSEHIGRTDAVVEVNRRLGALAPFGQAASFIASHIGEGQIRATNRESSGFVVVAVNGTACGWHAR